MTKFKYQNIIKDAINETYYAQAPLYFNCLGELDDVYKQAAQNKEDKIKAEAWDEAIEILKELRDFNKKRNSHSDRLRVKYNNFADCMEQLSVEFMLTYEEIRDKYDEFGEFPGDDEVYSEK